MNSLISETPQVCIATASKALVDKLLAMNTKNRTPKKKNIDRISNDVQRGRFELTASGVGVSKTGVLLDGQNRLMAIRSSGYQPVKFVLVTGLEDSSQKVVDRHSRRSLSDALSMHMNITISSSMVALTNALHFCNAARTRDTQFFHASAALSDSEVADFLVEHGELAADVVKASGSIRTPVLAAIFVYALHSREAAIEFAREVSKGVNLSEDSPAYRLRLAIERLKRASDAAGRMELFKLSATACMTHSNGRTIRQLKASESWSEAKWRWAIRGDSIFSQDE